MKEYQEEKQRLLSKIKFDIRKYSFRQEESNKVTYFESQRMLKQNDSP